MTRECPECEKELTDVDAGGATVGFTCYACGVLWYGVTGIEVRFNHPETDGLTRENLKA